MSRVSSKSSLSPSATSGSSAIDLGKDSGVNLGEKTQTSVSTGGIGVTREVANIGGMSVTGGVSVEVSPVRLDISGNVDYADPTKSSVSIGAGAEIPGGLLGVSGGVTINTTTGAIEEVSIGGEVAAFGANVSVGSDGSVGLEFTFQIPLTPIELSLGFGSSKDKKPTPTPIKEPSLEIPSDFPKGLSVPGAGTPPSFAEGCMVYEAVTVESLGGWDGFKITGSAYNYATPEPSSSSFLLSKVLSSQGSELRKGGVKYYIGLYAAPFGADSNTITQIEVLSDWHSYSSNSVNQLKHNSVGKSFVKPANSGWILIAKTKYEVKSINCKPVNSPSFPSFPNPPPRKEKMDECCRENLKLLRAIHKGLGIAKFPGKMPSTIIQTIPKKGGQPAEPPQVPVDDWVDLFMWNFKRDDERWGQWEIQIDVKDSDLTKEGDQGKSIKFPNLAESVAEMEGQLLSLLTNVEALVAIQTKCLVESGMARQEAIKGYLASKAIIKYMAFKSTEIDVSVPMTFTAGAESISALIKESEGHIKGTDYVEKETLRDILLDLLQAAAVIRAVHWQKIDTKTDTKSQLLGLLKGSVDLANSFTKPKGTDADGDGNGKFDPAQNFEDFIDSAEDGFTNSTGITDIQNPYGKTRDRRPRIRQIGDNISQAGGNK
jgi:hypothetical protein